MAYFIKSFIIIVSLVVMSTDALAVSEVEIDNPAAEEARDLVHRSIRAAEVHVQISHLNKILTNDYKGFEETFQKLKELKALR